MPKILYPHFTIFFLAAAGLLTACGQKGPLYLEKDAPKSEKQQSQSVFAPKQAERITTTLVQLNALNIGGTAATLNPAQLPSWKAILNTKESDTNAVHYVSFDGDVLANQRIGVVVGQVQNPRIKAPQQRSVSAGRYLRVRSLETGASHMPSLLSAAKDYLAKNPALSRTPASDFLIDSAGNLDLYLSVEKK